MTSKYGMFIEHQYLRPGNPPFDKDAQSTKGSTDAAEGAALPDKDHGLNFKVTVCRTGKNNDATFDKYITNNVGDKYLDPLRKTLQAKNEANKGIVSSTPFKAVSPMKKSTGAGDNYGTLSGKVPYIPGSTTYGQKKKEDIKSEPRGFYTSPAKKGTYGFIKTTLSERQGYKGVATEYEYQHEPEELTRARRRAEREADAAARAGSGPFKPANPPKRGGPGVPNTTISKGKGVAGEWEYVVGSDAKQEGTGKSAAEAATGTPFRPASLYAKHLGKQPEYIHDPELPKIEAEKTKKREEIKRLAATGPWKPNMSSKSDMTRSIICMNI